MPTTPQDRRPKTVRKPAPRWRRDDDTLADFEHTPDAGGDPLTLTEAELAEVLTPGFIRRNRHQGPDEMSYLLLEALGRDDVLDVLDESWRDYKKFSEDFGAYVEEFMGLKMGESSAS